MHRELGKNLIYDAFVLLGLNGNRGDYRCVVGRRQIWSRVGCKNKQRRALPKRQQRCFIIWLYGAMVDTLDSKSGAERYVGSTPTRATYMPL